jgi:hypothetical protein
MLLIRSSLNFYTPTVFKSIGFDGTKVVLLASGRFISFLVVFFPLRKEQLNLSEVCILIK